jgi:DNA-binding NtrC family response regulator
VLKQALLSASGTVLVPAFLPDLLAHEQRAEPAARPAEAGGDFDAFIRQQLDGGAGALYAAAHEKLDRLLLPLVLQFTEGSQHQAARILGIARQTLRQKLRDLGLTIAHTVQTEDNDAK